MSDETTQTNDATPVTGSETGGGETQPTTDPAMVPSSRLREEAEAKRKALEENEQLKQQLSARDETLQQTQLQHAKELYGDIVEDEQVKEFKTKYPDMSYQQVFGALGLEVPTQTGGHRSTPGVETGAISGKDASTEYTISEVVKLQRKDPEEYDRIMGLYANGEVKLLPE